MVLSGQQKFSKATTVDEDWPRTSVLVACRSKTGPEAEFLKKQRKGTRNILSDPQPPSEGFENLFQGSKI